MKKVFSTKTAKTGKQIFLAVKDNLELFSQLYQEKFLIAYAASIVNDAGRVTGTAVSAKERALMKIMVSTFGGGDTEAMIRHYVNDFE